MARIITPPNIPVPQYRPDHPDPPTQYRKDIVEYLVQVRNHVLVTGKGPYRGRVVKFPVADGYAEYMVVSMRPLVLMHLPIGYDFRYIHRLTAEDIRSELE